MCKTTCEPMYFQYEFEQAMTLISKFQFIDINTIFVLRDSY